MEAVIAVGRMIDSETSRVSASMFLVVALIGAAVHVVKVGNARRAGTITQDEQRRSLATLLPFLGIAVFWVAVPTTSAFFLTIVAVMGLNLYRFAKARGA